MLHSLIKCMHVLQGMIVIGGFPPASTFGHVTSEDWFRRCLTELRFDLEAQPVLRTSQVSGFRSIWTEPEQVATCSNTFASLLAFYVRQIYSLNSSKEYSFLTFVLKHVMFLKPITRASAV